MFAAPPLVETTVFTRLPDALRKTVHTPFSLGRGGPALHSFLEGPSFDRDGYLYCVDIPHGRIFRISPSGQWQVFAEYEGEPNGLKIHRDGRIFVADAKNGILCFDPATGKRHDVLNRWHHEPLRAVNDLVFDANGDLYFTDPGYSDYLNPTGRVFRLRATGEVDLLAKDLPLPNGLVLNPQENLLYVALTRSNQIIAMPLRPNYQGVGKTGVLLNLSGGLAGPDGMAMDERGSLAVVHAGFGTVWVFSALGEPLHRIRSCTGLRTTNVAYGGPDRRTLYITEAESGSILQAQLPSPGRAMFSHS
jgi:gluconolactonase